VVVLVVRHPWSLATFKIAFAKEDIERVGKLRARLGAEVTVPVRCRASRRVTELHLDVVE